MSDFNESNKPLNRMERDNSPVNYNREILLSFMIFMFFYRFYDMHIDPNGIVIGAIENTFFRPRLELEDQLD
jgi:hypothetical protein